LFCWRLPCSQARVEVQPLVHSFFTGTRSACSLISQRIVSRAVIALNALAGTPLTWSGMIARYFPTL
jgi:hypothetical protein